MSDYDNEKRGVLFKNDRKDTEQHPYYKGSAQIEGVEYWLSAWIRTPKSGGDKFISISFQAKEQQNYPPEPPPSTGDDDSVPF